MLCFAALAVLSALGTQDALPRTEAHRWAFDGLALGEREGLFVEYPDDHRVRRPPSRYEIVVEYHALATNHLARAETFIKSPSDDRERASLLRCAALLPAYWRAEREFKREFVSLGIEDDFGQSRIAEATRQIDATSAPRHRLFSDVPVDHWAAKAVGDLRALGLLDGYPDDKYRG